MVKCLDFGIPEILHLGGYMPKSPVIELFRIYRLSKVRLYPQDHFNLWQQIYKEHGFVFVRQIPGKTITTVLHRRKYDVPGCYMFPHVSEGKHGIVSYDEILEIPHADYEQTEHELIGFDGAIAMMVLCPEKLDPDTQYLLETPSHPQRLFMWGLQGRSLVNIGTKNGNFVQDPQAKRLVGVNPKFHLSL